jgi:hypothetical protein
MDNLFESWIQNDSDITRNQQQQCHRMNFAEESRMEILIIEHQATEQVPVCFQQLWNEIVYLRVFCHEMRILLVFMMQM